MMGKQKAAATSSSQQYTQYETSTKLAMRCPPERRMLAMMGKQKAAVLPEPVCAHAIMSRPARPMGME